MRAYVCMPYNGLVDAHAARALYSPSAVPGRAAKVASTANSLLTTAFNELLCLALNARDAGDCTHFAMIHSDVAPEGPWLDVLAEEMEAHGADLVSAVVAIKEGVPDPQTSTAIGDAADRWAVKRCLRLSERAALPATFGPEHVCGPGEVLLVNTGLWLADLRRPWWDTFPGFRLHNEIYRDGSGRWRNRQRSEDWELSHHLHEAGARYLATWRVPVAHRGVAAWHNH